MKQGCIEKSWVSFYKKIGEDVAKMYRKFSKSMEFQVATKYNASDMVHSIELFAIDVKCDDSRLFQVASDMPITRIVHQRCKIVWIYFVGTKGNKLKKAKENAEELDIAE